MSPSLFHSLSSGATQGARVKSRAVFFTASKFPVFFIIFTRLPLPVFMDTKDDFAVSVFLSPL